MRKIARSKRRGRESSVPAAVLWGIAAAAAAELLLLALAAELTFAGIIGEGGMRAAAGACAFISSFAGAAVAAVKSPRLRLPAALAVGAVLLGLNLAAGPMLPEGEGISLLMPSLFMAGAVFAGVPAALKKGGKQPL